MNAADLQKLSDCVECLEEAQTNLVSLGEDISNRLEYDWKHAVAAVSEAVSKVGNLNARYCGGQ